jgi:hypothetical protein
LGFDLGQELLDHAELYVSLKQRKPDLPQCRLEVLFIQGGQTGEAILSFLKTTF